jgi:hypothetical protein
MLVRLSVPDYGPDKIVNCDPMEHCREDSMLKQEILGCVLSQSRMTSYSTRLNSRVVVTFECKQYVLDASLILSTLGKWGTSLKTSTLNPGNTERESESYSLH